MLKIYQQLPHLEFPIVEVNISYNMFALYDTAARLGLGNLDYRQSVVERQPNLVFKFACLKDLDDVDPFNIIRVDRVKKNEEVKVGVHINAVIAYKTPSVLNGKLVTVSNF